MGRLNEVIERIKAWDGWSHVKDVCCLLLVTVWLFQIIAGTWYYVYAQQVIHDVNLVSSEFNVLALFNIVVCLTALPPVAKAFKRLLNNR